MVILADSYTVAIVTVAIVTVAIVTVAIVTVASYLACPTLLT